MNENQDLKWQLYFGINYTIIRLKIHTMDFNPLLSDGDWH